MEAGKVEKEHHNVIIFGAGASVDAGVPVLNSFVDTMWGYAIRGKSNSGTLDAEQKATLAHAQKIRYELENYSSRAYFDSRNIEDVLSLLSFEALANPGRVDDYKAMVKSIALTIELACKFKSRHTGSLGGETDVYQIFWRQLLSKPIRSNLPALITFNYDLVLERSLRDYFKTIEVGPSNDCSCRLSYHHGEYAFPIKRVSNLIPASYNRFKSDVAYAFDEAVDVEIPYLKLHGSLNWRNTSLKTGERSNAEPTEVADEPMILPPVFNKMSGPKIGDVWERALAVLRRAKHIIIVGYSLPRTDVYMQYFLKSAVGPNQELQKIIVFDPKLHAGGEEAEQMKKRYQECFSPQFNSRISFTPSPYATNLVAQHYGKLFHFAHVMSHPDIWFTP